MRLNLSVGVDRRRGEESQSHPSVYDPSVKRVSASHKPPRHKKKEDAGRRAFPTGAVETWERADAAMGSQPSRSRRSGGSRPAGRTEGRKKTPKDLCHFN